MSVTKLSTLHAPNCHYAIIDGKVKHNSTTEIGLSRNLRHAGIDLKEYTPTALPISGEYHAITEWTLPDRPVNKVSAMKQLVKKL